MFRPVFRRFGAPALRPGIPVGALLLAAALAAPELRAQATEASSGLVPVFPARPSDTALVLVDPTAQPPAPDTARPSGDRDALHAPPPDSTWRWPDDPRVAACEGPFETVMDCWRDAPRRALRQTGFPGPRAGSVDLRTLEPDAVIPYFQGALLESQYGTGGHAPFSRYEPRGLVTREAWAPVQPLDTPVTDLHWTRGALFLNQFTFSLERMVGNRAYLGLEYHSDGAEALFYEYPFNVHQPYLGAGRDSSSLVIADSSHFIMARQLRPRLGFWLDPGTVLEVHGDFFLNRTSMARPTNPDTQDSTQSLYASSFSASTFGATLARHAPAGTFSATAQHALWGRKLAPDSLFRENGSGWIDRVALEWRAPAALGLARARLEAENTVHENVFRLDGPAAAPAGSARADRERLALEARPSWGPFTADLAAEGTRRARADGKTEWLGGADAELLAELPFGFEAAVSAGAAREGASEDLLFRLQPALGLYPNAALAPRSAWRYGASAGWRSRHLGLGAGWDRNIFHDNWLPATQPYPALGSLPDSLALRRENHDREVRDLANLALYLALGNWSLDVRQVLLLANPMRDAGMTQTRNLEIPEAVNKGRLLWKRRVLDGKLGLRTQWDWEWFSERYVFASDLDGTSRPIRLDEYLALDFAVSMEIRTFLLYFRAMNLNHDRYATEPGVHPPGVNFRFGVDWRIRN